VGQTLSHYRVLEQIGAGYMDVVYRAHDERLERDVALKVLPPGALAERGRKRFRKERGRSPLVRIPPCGRGLSRH
jgi:serine/threonine protein kinase